jgi:VWFA-related protein
MSECYHWDLMTIRRCVGLVACLLAVGVVRPSAQNPPAQNPPAQNPPASQGQAAAQSPQATFRSRIDSVMVDVAVTDKQGHPVGDLNEQDFEIRENNKVQTIDTFKLVKIDDTPIDPDTLPPILSIEDQQREVENDANRLIVIFLDDYHVRRENSLRIRQDLARFASQLNPRDLVAIMYPLMPPTALTFSRNRTALARDLMTFEGRKYDYTPRNDIEQRMAMASPDQIEQQRNLITISALETLCAYLGTMRDGRKTILLTSEGLIGSTPSSVLSGAPGNPEPLANSNLMTQFQDIFADAARSNTSLYTLDPRGLAVSEFGAERNTNMQADLRILNASIDSLRVLADNTGGRAIVSTNNPLPMLKQMLVDSSAYYLLGYTSTEKWRDGRFHPIKVRVLRKDAQVLSARPGYWAYSADDVAKMTAPPKPALNRELTAAFESISDTNRGHAVRLWIGAERGPDGKAIVTLAWEAVPADPGQSLGAVDHVNVTATSFMGDQLFDGPVSRDPQVAILAGRVTFAAPPGPVSVRAKSETTKGLRLDSDDVEVDVPDFTRVDLLITKPAVFRARTAVDIRQIRAAVSPMPTVSRDFQRSERLLIRFQAYGPAGKPTVTARLLNQIGEPMADLAPPVALADANFEMDMGLGTLAPAQYIIEITADAGGTQKKILLPIRITG